MVRKIHEIEKKVKKLKSQFDEEARFGFYENMGDKHLHEFNDYVGDIYQYSYQDRLKIIDMRQSLFEHVTS